jgi:hypothetical protein
MKNSTVGEKEVKRKRQLVNRGLDLTLTIFITILLAQRLSSGL